MAFDEDVISLLLFFYFFFLVRLGKIKRMTEVQFDEYNQFSQSKDLSSRFKSKVSGQSGLTRLLMRFGVRNEKMAVYILAAAALLFFVLSAYFFFFSGESSFRPNPNIDPTQAGNPSEIADFVF